MLLQNQVALITGSGRGIGRAIARLFAKEGAAAFLTARTEKELAATAAEITKDGGRAAFITADLALEKGCGHVASAAREKFGKINNPFAVLEMEESNSISAVKTAYRKVVLKYHPDKRNGTISEEEANHKFREVKRAYEMIIKKIIP